MYKMKLQDITPLESETTFKYVISKINFKKINHNCIQSTEAIKIKWNFLNPKTLLVM